MPGGIAILIRLAKRRRDQAQLGVTTSDNNATRNTTMLIAVMLAYMLFNFPAYAYSVVVRVGKNDGIIRFLVLLISLGIGVNFYLYFLTSPSFRNAVINLFRLRHIHSQP